MLSFLSRLAGAVFHILGWLLLCVVIYAGLGDVAEAVRGLKR